jgi:hypothetical protein
MRRWSALRMSSTWININIIDLCNFPWTFALGSQVTITNVIFSPRIFKPILMTEQFDFIVVHGHLLGNLGGGYSPMFHNSGLSRFDHMDELVAEQE